jgi:lysophospholipase L1-like esterase
MKKPAHAWLNVWLLAALPVALTAQQGTPTSPDPLRWEETMLEFEAQDAVTPPPQNAILITGSSSIARWHPRIVEDLAPLTIIPRGFGGSEMSDVLHWVDRVVIAYRPRAVVIYEGDNDTGRSGKSAETIAGQFEEIAGRIHAALPDTRIYVLSVKPSVSRWAVWPEAQRTNRMLEQIAAEDDLVYYVDVASPLLQANGEVMTDIFVADNLHLNEKGTDIWAATIREALMIGEAGYESTDGEDE